jgi:hypothetical protein
MEWDALSFLALSDLRKGQLPIDKGNLDSGLTVNIEYSRTFISHLLYQFIIVYWHGTKRISRVDTHLCYTYTLSTASLSDSHLIITSVVLLEVNSSQGARH